MAEQVNGSLLFRCIDCGGSYGPAMMWLDSGRCVVCAVCDAVSVTRASASGATTSTADAIKAATLEANAKGEGFKADQEKTDFTLLPWEPLEDVARVMMLGAEKYARDRQAAPESRGMLLPLRGLVRSAGVEAVTSEKRCSKCGETKPLAEFERRGPSGGRRIRSECRTCRNKIETERRHRLKDTRPRCSAPVGCPKPSACGGLCWGHYARKRRGESLETPVGFSPKETTWIELTEAALKYAAAESSEDFIAAKALLADRAVVFARVVAGRKVGDVRAA